jgi:hypothetical protein
MENAFEEACDADGVYVVLQDQMWSQGLKCCGSFSTQRSKKN